MHLMLLYTREDGLLAVGTPINKTVCLSDTHSLLGTFRPWLELCPLFSLIGLIQLYSAFTIWVYPAGRSTVGWFCEHKKSIVRK